MVEFYDEITPTTISTDYTQSNEENTKAPSLEQDLYNEIQSYFTDWQEVWTDPQHKGIVLEVNQALRLAQLRVQRDMYIPANQWVNVVSTNLMQRYLPPQSLRQLAYNTDTFVEINLGTNSKPNAFLKCKSATGSNKKLRTVFTYHYNRLDKPPQPDDPDEPTE